MNLLNKTILILITSSVFIFLIFVTFITNNLTTFDKPYYEITKKGLYELIQKDNSYTLSSQITNSTGGIFVDQINTSDKVLFSYGTVKSEVSTGSILINITPGIYLFQLNEINSNYIITGEGFELTNKGPGIFIINSLNSRKVLAFSINSLLSLKLKNIKTNEIATTVFLYPHEYLIFNPLKNIFVKNADLLKIEQTFTLGYFNNEINLSDNFLNLISLRNKKGKSLITQSLLFLENEKKLKEKYIENFSNSKFGLLPGEKIINKYFKFFINPNKKSLYYKNIIIREINELLKNENIDNSNINDIYTNLNELAIIDKQGAELIIKIINFHYINVIISNSSINSKINFSKLTNKINNKDNPTYLPSLLYLQEIFNNYSSKDFYKNINEFTNKYFEDLKISMDAPEKNKTNINEVVGIDYLLYFLGNIVLNSDISLTNDIGNIITVFNKYVKLSNGFYKYSDTETKRIGLYTYSKILNKFIKILDDNYFEKNSNKKLLILKEGVSLNKNKILLLERDVNNIFSFFNNNKIVLNINKSTKDRFLNIKIYPDLIKKYNEYFLALKDYEEYLATYDTTKKELLETNSINEGKTIITLTINKAKKYLQGFKGVEFQNTKITIMDYVYCSSPSKENENIELINPYCYKIDDLILDKQKMSFILYPFTQNKINNITIAGVKKSGTYKLDNIESELKQKLKTVKTNKELYIFENFLFNTFGRKLTGTNSSSNNTNSNIKPIEQEDPVIRIFKRNKLLGTKGDFANINGTINIAYNDLEVEKKGDKYNININSSDFYINISKNESYRGKFSSNYNFSEKHSFINPELILIEKKSEKYLLLGNKIYITGEYKVNTIKEELTSLLKNYKEINFSIKTISEILNNSKINITYNKDSGIITFNTTYNGNEVILQLLNGKIIHGTYKGNNIIKSSIDYESINSILINITK